MRSPFTVRRFASGSAALLAATLLASAGVGLGDDAPVVSGTSAVALLRVAVDTSDEANAEGLPADPLEGVRQVDPATTGPDAAATLEKLLPPRSDTAADWLAPLEPLHWCGEPRTLPTCVPPPPCHPSRPPQPFDLVGIRGGPTCGPIYRGPCAPRTGTHDNGPWPHLHRACDRLFDRFYDPRPPILP